MTPAGHVKLTPLRVSILRLARSEGAIYHTSILNMIRGRNLRTAKSQLKGLHAMGLLKPIRNVEFVLSDDGDRWLDNHDSINGGGQ